MGGRRASRGGADGQHLPFPTDAFDCVLETESLEWIKDPVRYFREAARTCAPTGVVISDDSDWDTVVYAVSGTTPYRRGGLFASDMAISSPIGPRKNPTKNHAGTQNSPHTSG